MSLSRHRHFHRTSKWLTLVFGTVTIGIVIASVAAFQVESAQALILPHMRKKIPWVFIEPEQIEEGVTVPPDSHVIIHLPESFRQIAREVLLGHDGKTIRYWGYCLPQNYEPTVVEKRRGLPGKLFLSEAERAARAERERAKRQPFSVFRLPTKKDVQENRNITSIRHELEMFTSSLLCYLMTESPLALGLDEDSDSLNIKLEQELGTDSKSPDTDFDGIWDGIEYFTDTSPLFRDSDTDGLIDGIEDRNWNGRIDPGESDPRTKDSDRDHLCDGLCRVKIGRSQQTIIGEDLNLNGLVEQGETDPLKKDTNGDGVEDYTAYLRCQMGENALCIR